MRNYLRQWWMIFCGIALLLFTAWQTGYVELLLQNDVSYLGIGMIVFLPFFSLYIGYKTYRATRKDTYTDTTPMWWIATKQTSFGLAGTIIGFAYLIPYYGVDNNTTEIVLGLGTVISTTLVGLLNAFLLEFQLVNLDHAIENYTKS